MPKREVKHVYTEIKAVAEDGTFHGYGSVFDEVDSYGDVVKPGAFKRTLEARKGKVRLLWQHDSYRPVGKFLSLEEDGRGLRFTGQFNLNTTHGRDAYEHVKAGDLDGMSIGFVTVQEESDSKNGVRNIKEVKLYEISVVTFPANEAATITAIKAAAETSPESLFDSLTPEQRLEVIEFMHHSVNRSNEEQPSLQPAIDPPAEVAEPTALPPESEALSAPEPDKEPVGDPPASVESDEDLKHSLKQLKAALKSGR